jgi:N-methylhydantoinase A
MGYRVAIDIGGGFTDLVAVDENGQMHWSKDQTTPADLTVGVVNVFRRSGIDPGTCHQLLHGQTLVINTIVQRKGARVGLITTKGFRDVLEIQRSNRRDIFNLRYRKPEPFVPRYMRYEVDERTMADGTVLKNVNPAEVAGVYRKLRQEGAESVAICFINSYVNPSNEREAHRTIEALGGASVTASSDVTREWREYERTNTAVLNAYVMPLIEAYVKKLVSTFKDMRMKGQFYMMLSSGGVATFDFVRRVPIQTVESGPIAGVVAGTKMAELIGERNVIVLDGGSTTTKASLMEDLTIRFTTDYAVERDEYRPGYPIKVPIIDIVEIGNGGGSVAWLDEVGNLRVGPVSAGAVPGPACYGLGGTKPTLTDAYIVAGLLNPEYFLGGQLRLDADLARQSMSSIAKRFSVTVEEAAFAVIRLANDNAAQLLRLISVQRGYDPREFTLMAHGGSGPLLSAFIAEELEIPKVVVPVVPPGNFSAWGLLMSDLKHDVTKTTVRRLDSPGAEAVLNKAYAELYSEMIEVITPEAGTEILLHRSADLRYYGQEHTIRVSVAEGELREPDVKEIVSRFQEQHRREYGFVLDTAVELVNVHLTGVVPTAKPSIGELSPDGRSVQGALKGERKVFWGDEWRSTAVYDRQRLPPHAEVVGPAVLEEPTSTTPVRPGQTARLDRYGNLILGAS